MVLVMYHPWKKGRMVTMMVFCVLWFRRFQNTSEVEQFILVVPTAT